MDGDFVGGRLLVSVSVSSGVSDRLDRDREKEAESSGVHETEALIVSKGLIVSVKDIETDLPMVPETEAETENDNVSCGDNESVPKERECVGGGERVGVRPESEPETDLSLVSETVTVLDSVPENERVLSAVFVSEKLLVGVGGGVTVYVAVISSVSDFEIVRVKEMESSGDQETDADSSGVPVPAQRRDRLKDRVGVGGGVRVPVYVSVRETESEIVSSGVEVTDKDLSAVSLNVIDLSSVAVTDDDLLSVSESEVERSSVSLMETVRVS